jgi:hypothetical protein
LSCFRGFLTQFRLANPRKLPKGKGATLVHLLLD